MKPLHRLVRILALVVAAVSFATITYADVRVPLGLQAQLVRRLAGFDRNFAARATGTARVLVVHKSGDDESRLVGGGFAKALSELHDIAGVPMQVDEMPLADPAALAAQCKAQHVAILYFSVGLEPSMEGVAGALAGVDVMTIGASSTFAEKGAVVGFDLEEGRPKIVVNLARAKAHNVSFKAELLKLARIVN